MRTMGRALDHPLAWLSRAVPPYFTAVPRSGWVPTAPRPARHVAAQGSSHAFCKRSWAWRGRARRRQAS